MSISMYSQSVPVFTRALNNILAWLDKAEAHATARGFEADNYLGLRLAPDMAPFTRQIQIATDSVKGCVARLSGTDAPSWPDEEATVGELRERIKKAIAFAEAADAALIDKSGESKISLPLPSGAIEFTGESFLTTFVLPNFFFHVTLTYALLRHGGVDLGKMDFLGAP